MIDGVSYYVLMYLPPTIIFQLMNERFVWKLKRMTKKRMVVRIHRVTATNITQPYADVCT